MARRGRASPATRSTPRWARSRRSAWTRIYWYDAGRPGAAATVNGALLTHYGSPVITSHNTVIVPVKTGAAGGFRVEARVGGNGGLIWSANTDYLLPPHNWVPSYNPR